MTEPILNKEQEAEFVRQRRDGEAVRQMTETTGWEKMVYPRLIDRRQALLRGLLNAKEFVDFLTAQQAINTIDYILKMVVEQSIVEGERASEALESARNSYRKEIADG